jgi:hypothetical protein
MQFYFYEHFLVFYPVRNGEMSRTAINNYTGPSGKRG